MIINSAGNVGIGDTTPDALLDVAGIIQLDSDIVFTGNSNIRRNTSDGSDDGYILISGGGNPTQSRGAFIQLSGNESGSVGTAYMYPGNHAGSDVILARSDGTGILVVDGATGNVGMGAGSSPTYTLQVNGQPAANGYTAWTNYSDIRLKENINDLVTDNSSVLAKIAQIRPVTYNYNSLTGYDEATRSRRISGFIAQELQTVFPEMVGTTTINGTQYFDTNLSDMPLYLVKGVQELNLNLEGIAGTATPLPGSASESFVTNFFTNLFSKITTWLADAGNGIAKIFTGEVETKLLCIADDAGNKTCLDKVKIDLVLANAGTSGTAVSGGSESSTTDDEQPTAEEETASSTEEVITEEPPAEEPVSAEPQP
ncbi:MAG: tail fiber domain-containing protein [Candidatus Zambryskibacteria bacterium]|nr:tail fiber domain-containing protein [Candidatus Zambryskibacteria bacterium]